MVESGAVNWYTVLPVGLDPESRERVCDALAPLEAVVTVGADDWSEALELASAGHYDGLVVAYPLGDAPMVGFLASLRRPACPCRNSAVVLLTEDCAKAEAETYLGRGANKVLTWGRRRFGCLAFLRIFSKLPPGSLSSCLSASCRSPKGAESLSGAAR